ncbi:MAG: AEC family transporter [Clostridia bacterium]|nr:AEC family transporter [Clostridia bacterium]MBQ7407614.1 AEC family transporter [Clostridia bacterium]
MKTFLVALGAVAVLLAAAVPGYVLKKKNMVSEDTMPSLSKILLYICTPCLSIYTFKNATFSMEMLGNIGVFSLLALLVQVIILGIAYLLFRRKMKEPLYRIMTIACALGNCAFFGIPILEALYPETASGLLIYTSVYAIIMNVIGWTIGAAIISQNLKYVSVKKVLLNPATVALVLAVPFFVFEIPLPESLDSMISLIGRMATPISMLIMGMRLATTDLKRLFTTKQIYIAIFMKQFAMALVCLLLVAFLPVDGGMKAVLYIICCCPVASVVLNFSEILGEGQKEAASAVLLSTLFSIVTLPIMVLLLPA